MNLNAVLLGSQIGKAIGLVVILGMFLVWWNLVGDPGSPVGTREVGGVIAEVHEQAYVVQLDSGQRVRVFRTVHAEVDTREVGTRVQLISTKFASGEESFALPETGLLSQ